MKIIRSLLSDIREKITTTQKTIIIYGPRQVGKTTLIHDLIKSLPYRTLTINADEGKYSDVLSSRDFNRLHALVSGYELLFIDEAQKIPDIGINLKILHDQIPSLKKIVTGSSSLDLANRTQEPLTGRTWTYQLFPISLQELSALYNPFELNDRLSDLMIYGSYPEIFSIPNMLDKKKYLKELCASYLYKDILELTHIKHSHKLFDLLRLLAFQIGSQVSLQEIGNSLGMSKDTVSTYIDLLEKSFVLFRLSGFSRNRRKEVTKSDKFYFYDLGIRNAIIDNFNPLSQRSDVGQLWENFLIGERKKFLHYHFEFANQFFWRLYTGAEIDYIEEQGDSFNAYEFKFTKKISRPPKSWFENYPKSKFLCINRDNYLSFLIRQ